MRPKLFTTFGCHKNPRWSDADRDDGKRDGRHHWLWSGHLLVYGFTDTMIKDERLHCSDVCWVGSTLVFLFRVFVASGIILFIIWKTNKTIQINSVDFHSPVASNAGDEKTASYMLTC